jgi:hypothetical protein
LALLPACSSVSPTSFGAADSAIASEDEENSTGQNGTEPGGDTGDTGETDEEPPTPADVGEEPSVCDPWLQDCPPDRKCTYRNDDGEYTTTCVPVNNEPVPEGAECEVIGAKLSGADNCELGAICSFVDENNQGICLELCTGSLADPGCPGDDSFCRACEDCPSICAQRCDPLLEDCTEGLLCLPFDQVFGCWEAVDEASMAQEGAECEYANQCGSGLGCVAPENYPNCAGVGCCTPYCDLQLDVACPDYLSCVPYFGGNAQPTGYENLGICLSA